MSDDDDYTSASRLMTGAAACFIEMGEKISPFLFPEKSVRIEMGMSAGVFCLWGLEFF